MAAAFDLEHAIAAWRRPYDFDRTEALVGAGMPVEAAFHEALPRMGSYGTAETEYRKAYYGKVRQRHAWSTEIAWRLTMLQNYLLVAW